MSSKFWYEQYPAVFRAEIETLQNGPSDFEFQALVPLETSEGHVNVFGKIKIDETDKVLVVIVFPPSYPFSPAEIIPIQGMLGPKAIAPMRFNRGNQYDSGKLCLFKDEDVWRPFIDGVELVVQEAKRWLITAKSPEGFTKDLVVVESNGIIQPFGQLLSLKTKDFPEAKQGKLFLKSFKKNYYSLLQIQLSTPEGIQAIETFQDGTVLSPFKNELIVASWFRVPNMTPEQLLPQFQSGENLKNFLALEYGVEVANLLPETKGETKTTVVGFIVGESRELHCFQLSCWSYETAVQFKPEYLLPKDLSEELFARVKDLYNLESLLNKNVLVVGLGAIGSEVAKELSCSPIGNFVFVDQETFDVGNTVRHAADLRFVGEAKVDVVKTLVQARNPSAKVTAIRNSVLNLNIQELEDKHGKFDVVLDMTANRLVENYLNQKFFIERSTPVIQAAASKGALTGIVLALIPGRTACLECLKNESRNHVPITRLDVSGLRDVAPDYGACSQPALPGAGTDSREIALQAARLTLQTLLHNHDSFYPKSGGYQYYWHGPAGKVVKDGQESKPFDWEIASIGPLKECNTCIPKS